MNLYNNYRRFSLFGDMNFSGVPKILIREGAKRHIDTRTLMFVSSVLLDYHKNMINPLYMLLEDMIKLVIDINYNLNAFKGDFKKLAKHKMLYITRKNFSFSEIYNMLNVKNSPTGCLFCGYDRIPLDKHHYPIPHRDGGTEVINLCPNCHREFHVLERHPLYEIRIDMEFYNIMAPVLTGLMYEIERKEELWKEFERRIKNGQAQEGNILRCI